jgi:hypothetical protein
LGRFPSPLDGGLPRTSRFTARTCRGLTPICYELHKASSWWTAACTARTSTVSGVGISLLGWGPGIVVGKPVADVAFYLPVIWIYERRRRKA